MSLITSIDPKDATGEVSAIYEQIQKQMGMIPNGIRAWSASTHRLKTQVAEIGYYMAHPTLSAQLTASIRYIVAVDHGCEYCVTANGARLTRSGWSQATVDGLARDPAAAPLEPKERAMLLTVVKATRTPHAVGEADIAELRALGWTDGDILDGIGHGAFSMAFDLVLSALKVGADGK